MDTQTLLQHIQTWETKSGVKLRRVKLIKKERPMSKFIKSIMDEVNSESWHMGKCEFCGSPVDFYTCSFSTGSPVCNPICKGEIL